MLPSLLAKKIRINDTTQCFRHYIRREGPFIYIWKWLEGDNLVNGNRLAKEISALTEETASGLEARNY